MALPKPFENIKNSDKRIAIFGKFSRNPNVTVFKLHAGAPEFNPAKTDEELEKLEKQGRLSETDLFRLLQPSLVSIQDGPAAAVQMGEDRWNGYSFIAPSEFKEGKAADHPLGLDSAILQGVDLSSDRELDGHQKIQAAGARLFKDLVDDLTAVAPFQHPNFAKALFSLGSVYLVRRLKEVEAAFERWSGAQAQNFAASSLLVRALICHPADLSSAIQAYWDVAIEHEGIAPENRPRAGKVVEEAIRDLRRALSQGEPFEESRDALLKELTLSANLPWLKAMDGGEWRIPGASGDGDGTSLQGYYRSFRKHSDRIHQAMRTPSFGSYLVCYLAAKYSPHGMVNAGSAAREMARLGVLEQKEKRVVGLSSEEAAQVDAIARQAQEEYTLEGENLEALKGNQNYVNGRAIGAKLIRGTLMVSPRFTREELADYVEARFETVAKLAGGSIQEILINLKATSAIYIPLYYSILRLSSDVSVEDAQETLKNDGDLGEESLTLVDDVFTKIEKSGNVRENVLQQFVIAYCKISEAYFATQFADNVVEIDKESETIRNLYRLRRDLEVTGSGSGAGTAGTTLTHPQIVECQSDGEREEIKEALKKSHSLEANDRMPQSTPVRSAEPSPDGLPLGKSASLLLDGQVVPGASVTSRGDDGLVFKGISKGQAAVINEGKATAKPEGDEDADAILLTDVQIAENEMESFDDVVGASEKLSDKMKQIAESFIGEGKGDADIRAELRQQWRAFLAGEYLLSAPDGAVALGKDDVSLSLRVILEMIATLPTDQPDCYQIDVALGEPILRDINLSEAYRLSMGNEKEQMDSVLQYHYDLCGRFEEINDYVNDLNDLRKFVTEVGNSVEVIVVNQTLTEHLDNPEFKKTVFGSEMPGFVYISGQGGLENELAAKLSARKFKNDMVVPVVSPMAGLASVDVSLPEGADRISNYKNHRLPFLASMIKAGSSFGAITSEALEPFVDTVTDEWVELSGIELAPDLTFSELAIGIWCNNFLNPLYEAKLMSFVLAACRIAGDENFDNLDERLKEIVEKFETGTLNGIFDGLALDESKCIDLFKSIEVKVADAYRRPGGNSMVSFKNGIKLGREIEFKEESWMANF